MLNSNMLWKANLINFQNYQVKEYLNFGTSCLKESFPNFRCFLLSCVCWFTNMYICEQVGYKDQAEVLSKEW